MKHSIMLSILISLATASSALAGDIAGPEGSNCIVYVPDGWKVSAAEKGGEGLMSAESPASDAAFMWALTNAANTDKAVATLDAILGKFVTNMKHDKAAKTTLNGMAALAITGTGAAEGKPVSIAVVIVEPTKGKYLFTIGLVETANKAAYKTVLQKVLAGIRRAS